MHRRRLIIKDKEDDYDPVIQVRSSSESCESIGEVNSDVSNTSDGDRGLTKGTLLLLGYLAVSSKRIGELKSRFGVPSG